MHVIRYHKRMSIIKWNGKFWKFTVVEWLILAVFVYFFCVLEPMMLARLIILFISVVVHEVAHGAAALWCGDSTAKQQGRLSFNPIRHVDPLGSVVLPLVLVVSGSPILFGWAKPVPVNIFRLQDPENDMVKVALAGPLSNITLAVTCSSAIKWLGGGLINLPWAAHLLVYGVMINCVLAVFNMVPIPPMDGSRVLHRMLPPAGRSILDRMEPYGLLIIMMASFFGVFGVILSTVATPLIHLLL
jgi:Zn-dependent protease